MDDFIVKSVGKKLANSLSDAGIKTIEQLKTESKADVEKFLTIMDRLDLYFDHEKNEINPCRLGHIPYIKNDNINLL